jgi:hypothetical protein
MANLELQKREKNAAIRCLQAVHAKHCPIDNRGEGPMNCGCAIGLTYRLLCAMPVKTV